MVALARNNNPTASFNVMDCRDISGLHKKYDGIMCGFCLPYLTKEEAIKLIHNGCDLLHSGGAIYLSTMEDDYNKSGFKKSSSGDEMFMHYHEAGYLSNALIENGCTITYQQHQDYPGENGNAAVDLLIIAVK